MTATGGSGPLAGILVVALEQAVAAPYCSSRLADAGARVIKVERPEGDFARGYDQAVCGESAYFVWINRGKESIALDLRQAQDRQVLEALLARADVFIQNLAPGAARRLGLDSTELRQRHPRLITCDISGYGEQGPMAHLKAYDLLVQAESGLVAVNGAPGEWGRIGVSVCDISAGLNALIAIQQALIMRERTGCGSGVKVSLFDSAAELMSVPYLQTRYGGKAPQRQGLRHPTIAPYGAFACADGHEIVIAIQNEREWEAFCRVVLKAPELIADERSCNNGARVKHRDFVDGFVSGVLSGLSRSEAVQRLAQAQIAFGRLNEVEGLIEHAQLRTKPMPVGGQLIRMPAQPWITEWEADSFAAAPQLNEHGAAICSEFALSASAQSPDSDQVGGV